MKQATHFTVHLKRPQLPPNLDPYEKYFGMPVRSGKKLKSGSRSAVSQGEIGYLLGFQDGNSFLRAYKGWTGSIPSEYRNEQSNLGFVR